MVLWILYGHRKGFPVDGAGDFCQVIVSGWFLMDNRDLFGWQHGGCSLAISSSVFNLDVPELGWHLGFISWILDS